MTSAAILAIWNERTKPEPLPYSQLQPQPLRQLWSQKHYEYTMSHSNELILCEIVIFEV